MKRTIPLLSLLLSLLLLSLPVLSSCSLVGKPRVKKRSS